MTGLLPCLKGDLHYFKKAYRKILKSIIIKN